MSNVFRGGIPYAIDVKRLIEAFPVPSLTEGRVIHHAQLEAIVNSPRGSQRYYGVVNSWLANMKNANGIFMVWEASVGLEVLDPAKLLTHAEIKTRQKIRQTGRAVAISAWVDRARLNPIGQQRLDHYQRVTAVLMDATRAAKKDLAVGLAPIQSLPRPKLIPKPETPKPDTKGTNDDGDPERKDRIS